MKYSLAKLEIDLDKIVANYRYLFSISNNSVALANFGNHTIPTQSRGLKIHPTSTPLGVTNLRKSVEPASEISAVLKANAYGLGANEIALKLSKIGCKKFFVAHLEEGIRLRKVLSNDAMIFVLNGVFENESPAFVEYGLTPVINYYGQFKLWQDHALKINQKLDCILHFNTGMNRFEIPESEIPIIVESKQRYGVLNVLYIMSHLACADEYDNEYNDLQLRKFNKIRSLFPGIKASLANSSALFLGNQYHFDLIRPGMALYGLNPYGANKANPMSLAFSLKTKILQIKKIPSDDTIGYGRAEGVKAGSIVATIALGYADGYSRQLSHKGRVYISGFPAKIIGKISMDLTTLDLSAVPEQYHQVGQEVEVFGPNISPEVLALETGGFNYEFLTSLGLRHRKLYSGLED